MKSNICVKVETLVELRQINAATGKLVSQRKPVKNLVMDNGLNALAQSTNACNTASFTTACRVGSGSTADKISSGAITFTQSGTTITASAPFFTAGMVGYIFKWGTGTAGNEVYITAFTDSQNVTVDTSATVGTPDVATVWNVARTTLETLLYSTNTYETIAGACQTTNSGNQRSHKRTFNFAQQVSSYNVNEVGYFTSTAGTTVFGRVVLTATEVVAPTNFLQVVLTVTFTYSPSAPTAVGDVGTNIDTSGNAMIEQFGAFSVVNSNGTTTAAQGDGNTGAKYVGLLTNNYTQNGTIGASDLLITTPSGTQVNAGSWTYASVRGKMTVSVSTIVSTAGQTLYGIGLGTQSSAVALRSIFDVKFTSTYALPTGSFLPQTVFSQTYNRALNN